MAQHSPTTTAGARPRDTPTISYASLARARTTVEDFVQTYFPLHGLHLQDFFRWWDVLVYVEATIYAMDEHNEAVTQTVAEAERLKSRSSGGNNEVTRTDYRMSKQPDQMSIAEHCLRRVLKSKGLWDDRVSAELRNGREYWRLERSICTYMAQRPVKDLDVGGPTPGIVVPGAHRAHQLKSFDYRVLHLILHQLIAQGKARSRAFGGRMGSSIGTSGVAVMVRDSDDCPAAQAASPGGEPAAAADLAAAPTDSAPGNIPVGDAAVSQASKVPAVQAEEPTEQAGAGQGARADVAYDEALLAFMRVDEQLVDISDDLVDYEDDVCKNSFNVLRVFVHLYGTEGQERLVEHIGDLEAMHSQLLAQLTPQQQEAYQRRKVEAAVAPGALRWQFPEIQYNEDEFRDRVQDSHSDSEEGAAPPCSDAVDYSSGDGGDDEGDGAGSGGEGGGSADADRVGGGSSGEGTGGEHSGMGRQGTHSAAASAHAPVSAAPVLLRSGPVEDGGGAHPMAGLRGNSTVLPRSLIHGIPTGVPTGVPTGANASTWQSGGPPAGVCRPSTSVQLAQCPFGSAAATKPWPAATPGYGGAHASPCWNALTAAGAAGCNPGASAGPRPAPARSEPLCNAFAAAAAVKAPSTHAFAPGANVFGRTVDGNGQHGATAAGAKAAAGIPAPISIPDAGPFAVGPAMLIPPRANPFDQGTSPADGGIPRASMLDQETSPGGGGSMPRANLFHQGTSPGSGGYSSPLLQFENRVAGASFTSTTRARNSFDVARAAGAGVAAAGTGTTSGSGEAAAALAARAIMGLASELGSVSFCSGFGGGPHLSCSSGGDVGGAGGSALAGVEHPAAPARSFGPSPTGNACRRGGSVPLYGAVSSSGAGVARGGSLLGGAPAGSGGGGDTAGHLRKMASHGSAPGPAARRAWSMGAMPCSRSSGASLGFGPGSDAGRKAMA